MNKIAFVIIHYGAVETTKNCLEKLKAKIENHQVILINNTTADVSYLSKIIPDTKLIENKINVGFAKAVNQGIIHGLSDKSVTHIMLLNNDLYLSSGTLRELLLTFVKQKTAGIVSPILHHIGGYDWGGKYNKWTGMVKHVNWENKSKTILSVEHVAGAAMLISRELIDQIGNFDERFFLYYEDLDFCMRARSAGYTIHINPMVVGEHATSSGSNLVGRTLHQWRSHLLFLLKYLPRQAYPTALIWDTIFYPLALLKAFLYAKS